MIGYLGCLGGGRWSRVVTGARTRISTLGEAALGQDLWENMTEGKLIVSKLACVLSQYVANIANKNTSERKKITFIMLSSLFQTQTGELRLS